MKMGNCRCLIWSLNSTLGQLTYCARVPRALSDLHVDCHAYSSFAWTLRAERVMNGCFSQFLKTRWTCVYFLVTCLAQVVKRRIPNQKSWVRSWLLSRYFIIWMWWLFEKYKSKTLCTIKVISSPLLKIMER